MRARLIHGLVEGLVEVGSLTMVREEGLVAGGILGRVEMVSCRTRQVEVREVVGMKAIVHLAEVAGA